MSTFTIMLNEKEILTIFYFPSSKDQCIVFKILGISDVLKLQLLGNKNIIFGYPAVELEMQM